MRILQLDLRAFGPFTDVSLSLDAGEHGLHIVYGPNEAGKSSALRALAQLFYGIPHASDDNFVHAYPKLRIGGVLRSADGSIFHFTRRKGRSKTLYDGDDVQPVDPKQIDELLDGLDEQSFLQRFGLDYKELVRGGRAIVEGGGDLGEVLFAAGTGIGDLGTVQDRLDERADALFKTRGSNQRINRAVSELKQARKAIRDTQLPSAEWDRHDQALRDALLRKETFDGELLKQSAEQRRLERILAALPIIAKRASIKEELDTLVDIPILSESFSEQRREAVTQLGASQSAEQEAQSALKSLEETIREVNVPTGLLEHRMEIQNLVTELGGHKKAAKDRQGLVARRSQLERAARTILLDLGREEELNDVEKLRVTRPQRLKIQELGNERDVLISAFDNARRTAASLQEQIEELKEQLSQLPETHDATRLRHAIRHAQQHGDLDQRLSSVAADLSRSREQSDIDLRKLTGWSGSLDELEQLALPSNETIDRVESRLNDATSAVNGLEQRITELQQDRQELTRQIEQLRLQQDVPTEDDLDRARLRRDEGWQMVLKSWKQGEPDNSQVKDFIADFAADEDLAVAFQASFSRVDELADRLRREADQVAKKANWIAECGSLDDRLQQLASEITAAQKCCDEIERQWIELWTQLGVKPLTPREMRTWAAAQSALASKAVAIRNQDNELSKLKQVAQSVGDELAEALSSIDLPEPKDSRVFKLLQHAEALLEKTEAANDEREIIQRDLVRFSKELSESKIHIQRSETSLKQWRERWRDSVTRLALTDDASPSQANSALEAIKELFDKLDEAEILRQRIVGIDRDSESFTALVRRVSDQVDGELPKMEVERAVAELHQRLTAAQTAHARREELFAQQQREQQKRDKSHAQANQFEAAIAAMCSEAKSATADELPEIERKSVRRQTLQRDLQQLDDQLVQLAAGTPFEKFVVDARQEDPDQLQPRIRQLSEKIEQLEQQRSEVSEQIGGERKAIADMDGSSGAAEAQEQAEHLLAQIQTDAEQYIRLRVAAIVLQGAIEQYRDRHKGPVLRHASETFAELTLGSFEGLRADYNDKGEPILVAVRPGGKTTVGVDGLSEGTETQLYLALRLASLETYLTDRTPIPFIIDDILKDFDDDRSVAALKVLARFSEQTQVILFTHHKHLVSLAEKNLDEDIVFVHELNNRDTTHTSAVSMSTG